MRIVATRFSTVENVRSNESNEAERFGPLFAPISFVSLLVVISFIITGALSSDIWSYIVVISLAANLFLGLFQWIRNNPFDNYLLIASCILSTFVSLQLFRLFLNYSWRDYVWTAIAGGASLHFGLTLLAVAGAFGLRLRGAIRSDL